MISGIDRIEIVATDVPAYVAFLTALGFEVVAVTAGLVGSSLANVILATAIAPVIVMANLGFLGFGVQPPEASWGSIVHDRRHYLREAPWVSVVPSVAITVTVIAINLFGDGPRDALDPRVRND